MAKDAKPAEGATSSQLAELFDCTVRQVEIYAKDKIVVRKGRGRYDAAMSTRNLVRHLRQQAAGRAGVDPETDTASANRERAQEQTLLTRTKRLLLEGKTADVTEVRRVWSAVIVGFRQMVLGLPGTINAVVPTLTVHDRRQIEAACRDLLKDSALGRGFDFGPPAEGLTQPENDHGDEQG